MSWIEAHDKLGGVAIGLILIKCPQCWRVKFCSYIKEVMVWLLASD